MTQAIAHIQTEQPERLVTRLSRHWGHRFPVSREEHHSDIELPLGRCRLLSSSEGLTVELQGRAEDMATLQQVVADHLQRMAGREELVIRWQ